MDKLNLAPFVYNCLRKRCKRDPRDNLPLLLGYVFFNDAIIDLSKYRPLLFKYLMLITFVLYLRECGLE